MIDVCGVLLIPTDGDPLGLLASTLEGTHHPPMAWQPFGRRDGVWRVTGGPRSRIMADVALTLAWQRLVVLEGLDRLSRCTGAPKSSETSVKFLRTILEAENADPQTGGWGTLIFIGPDGREVHP